jgi:hypothetical protein
MAICRASFRVLPTTCTATMSVTRGGPSGVPKGLPRPLQIRVSVYPIKFASVQTRRRMVQGGDGRMLRPPL